MKALTEEIAKKNDKAPGITLVIGAGNGARLDAFRRLRSKRLVLIEAHPQQAQDLARQIRPEMGEEIWQVAITSTAQTHTTLHAINDIKYSSVNKPTSLLDYFPNLRVVEEIKTAARTLSETIEELAPISEERNVLVLDAPGQAFALLQNSLAALPQLFDWIILQASVEALYSEDKPITDSIECLLKVGYEAHCESSEPPYPDAGVLLTRSETRIRVLLLETQVHNLSARCQRAEKAAKDSQHQLDKLNQESAALAICRDALTQENAILAKDRETQLQVVKKLETEVAALRKNKVELTATVKRLDDEKAGLIKSCEDQNKLTVAACEQVDSLRKQADELASERDTLVQKNALLAKDRETQLQVVKKLETEVAALRKEKVDVISTVESIRREKTELAKTLEEKNQLISAAQRETDALRNQRAELTSVCSALKQEKSVLTQGHAEQTKMNKELLKKAEELKKKLDALATERETKMKSEATTRESLEQAKHTIHSLESEASIREDRQNLLYEQLVKAEAQLDLLKDIFVRESSH